MPVHASSALQHEVDRCKVGDEEVEVKVEGLLKYLGAHHNVARGSLTRSAEAPCEPALALQTVAGHEARACSKVTFSAPSLLAKRAVTCLCACDRVADDKAASALGHQARDFVD